MRTDEPRPALPQDTKPASPWIHLTLSLVFFNIVAATLVSVSGASRNLLAALLVAAWLGWRRRDFELGAWGGVAGLALLTGSVLILRGSSALGGATGAVFVLVGVAGALRCEAASRVSIAGFGVLATVVVVFFRITPALGAPMGDLAAEWSSVVGSELFGVPLALGPTVQGLWVAMTMACMLVCRFLLAEFRPWRLLIGMAMLVAAHLAQLGVVRALPSVFASHHGLVYAPWVYFVIAVVPIVATVGCTAVKRQPAAAGGNRLAWGMLAVAGGSLFLVTVVPVLRPREHPRVVFYGVNEGPVLDFLEPEHGRYGAYSQGMFGLLTRYLRADGYAVDILRERIRDEHLEGVDALVTINVNTMWTESELRIIWSFVRDGGRLLVLGDHTDVDGSRVSQNSLLAPVGIEINFDGTVPPSRGFVGSWLFDHPIHAGVSHAGRLGMSVGGSLRLRGRSAEPLVIGGYHLADLGDQSAPQRAFLGDYRYEVGERVGDLVLAARARFGSGEFVVFGDTTGFQNASVMRSFDPFVRNVFSALTSDHILASARVEGALAIVFLLSAVGALVAGRRDARLAPALSLAILTSSSVATAWHETSMRRSPLDLPVAIIDASHAQRIDTDPRGKNGISGLILALQRGGYYVRTMRRWQPASLAAADVLVTIAPAIAYSGREAAQMESFMRAGGRVIAACGYPHKAGLDRVLRVVDLDIGDVPVGPIPLHRAEGRARLGVEYVEAWPVLPAYGSGRDAGVDVAGTGEFDVRGAFGGASLAVARTVGDGGLFLVGDSYFFSARNLEDTDSHSLPNVYFVRSLLEEWATEKGTPR